jgi:hypothetical protein
MKNIFRIKNIVIILISFFCFASCNGQDKFNPEYNVGTIPNISRFEKMTQNEIRIDKLMNKHHTERLQRMIDGTAFIKGVLEKDKRESIEYEKIKFQRYKDNRSRYYLDLFINDKKDDKHFEDIDTLTTECGCYLSGDTIKIQMGIWVFGGFTFSIDLTKNKFTSKYWEDTHKEPIYKTDLTDSSLVDNIFVENEEQLLILDKKPTFKIDENILGYLTFKTKNYYRTSEYQSGMAKDVYDGKSMDKLNMTGSLYFKCKVRQKTIGDK